MYTGNSTFLYQLGDEGKEIIEIQRILIGWGVKEKPVEITGKFDVATEEAVMRFQEAHGHYPSGRFSDNTLQKIKSEISDHRFKMVEYRCRCGKCGGFGRGMYNNEYLKGKPETEAYHKYEYPGIDLTLIWAVRALMHRAGIDRIKITSGYRCWYDNNRHHRRTTNHMGKAVDFVNVSAGQSGSIKDRIEDGECARIREVGIENCGFQAGWYKEGKVSLEMPRHGAYTWVHLDTRCIPSKFRRHIRSE